MPVFAAVLIAIAAAVIGGIIGFCVGFTNVPPEWKPNMKNPVIPLNAETRGKHHDTERTT